VSQRPSTGKNAPPSEPVRGFVAGYSVSETDELASGQGELDPYRTQLREIQVEMDRLRVELRDVLAQVEYWRTLAEYRKAMLDAQRDSTGQTPRYSLDGPRS
jgi:hypothetical protein